MAASLSAGSLWELLRLRSAEIIDAASLRRRLASRANLRVKLGVDPTTPDLHLGHALPLRLLRAFQDAGHQAVLIIGDFTARIGDPSGKPAARRQLSAREARANERTYRAQLGKILDLRRTEVRHNREWFGRMRLDEFLELLSRFPLRGAWEREDFQSRLRAGRGVFLHEAMYHVLQAYDSVAVRADVELGSLDQRLNLLAGRELQTRLGRIPQDVVLLPYLIGPDGRQKMSKTAGNTINLRDAPQDMLAKVMAVPDRLIVHYAELAAWLGPTAVAAIRQRLKGGENPRDVKLDVAEAVARLCCGAVAARRAREEFLRLFSRRDLSGALPAVRLAAGRYPAVDLIIKLGGARSRSQARRLLRSGAAEVDGHALRPAEGTIAVRRGSVVRIGKRRILRIR